MAQKKRNTLRLDTSGFNDLVTKLDELQGDVKAAVTESLYQASKKVHDDTVEAMKDENLPAHGKYKTGRTIKTIVEPKVEWSGNVASTPVGFDFEASGAGGYLIGGTFAATGTPRMKPDKRLNEIFVKKPYMRKLQEDMRDVITKYINQKMEGK